LVKAGQMLITKPDTKNLPGAVDVDVKKIMKTSRLITGFRKLGSQSLIAQTASQQDAQRAKGELYETNLAIIGAGTDIILLDPTHIPTVAQPLPPPSPPPVPPPTPTPARSEFGPPRTITAPN